MVALLDLDELAATLRSLTRLDVARLRDRFVVECLLEPDEAVTRIDDEIAEAEARLERVEDKIASARVRLNHLSDQIEQKTEILQALVRASTPPKAARRKD